MLNCYLIGETNLLVECAARLLKNKWKILGIFTNDEKIISWAKSNSILTYNQIASFEIDVFRTNFYCLFSISNPHLFNKILLKKAKGLIINYHNSLLPKYAGLNASSWAILNSEKIHGITWHLINEKIDAGDILYQVKFLIKKRIRR